MDRVPLRRQEIIELDAALMAAHSGYRRLRERYPSARLIPYPPVPAALSHSVVAAAIERFLGQGWSASDGGEDSALIARRQGMRPLRVEVKATAMSETQELTARDLAAELLVWLHFGRRYHEGGGPLHAYCLRRPKAFFGSPGRLTLPHFLATVADSRHFWEVRFDELVDIFRAPTRD